MDKLTETEESVELEGTLVPANNELLVCSQEHGLLKSCTKVREMWCVCVCILIGFKTDHTGLIICI